MYACIYIYSSNIYLKKVTIVWQINKLQSHMYNQNVMYGFKGIYSVNTNQ